MKSDFCKEAIQKALGTGAGSFDIGFFESVSSTNDLLKEKAMTSPEGTVIIAKRQTKGKGTGEHSFFSPEGGLYLSYLAKPRIDAKKAPPITALAAVAGAEAIENLTGKNILIKPINDLYTRNGKLAGILTESRTDENGVLVYAIIGIGVNVNAVEFPNDLKGITANLNGCVSRAELASEILLRLQARLKDFPNGDFAGIYEQKTREYGEFLAIQSRGK